MGAFPMATPVEKFVNRPFPGTKLDVPRLAAPRGPARGRARANLRDLMYRSFCLCTIAARPRGARARAGRRSSARPHAGRCVAAGLRTYCMGDGTERRVWRRRREESAIMSARVDTHFKARRGDK